MAASLGPPPDALVPLGDRGALDVRRAGTKAATLARLHQAGLPVPDGFVLRADVLDDPSALPPAIAWLAEHYSDALLAVRSSAVAEDRPDASFAGQYDTVLGVDGAGAVEAAIHQVRASAARVNAGPYRARVPGGPAGVAVLVQRLVDADAAGVALGCDPLTGSAASVLVCAVTGSGAPLVAGESRSEDWEVTDQSVRRRAGETTALTAETARAVAALVRRSEALLGHPQEVEWAVAGGRLYVLQSRPMTAMADPVEWRAPLPGGWLSGIRLGELLPDPVTPLFESWLLDRLERQFSVAQTGEGGFTAPAPWHVLVNGWYFHSPVGSGRQTLLVRGLLRRPRLALATLLGPFRPGVADRLFFRARSRRRDELTRYRAQVDQAQARIARAEPVELVELVDDLADAAGAFSWSLVLFGGAAWRAEIALARFCRRHLRGTLDSYQVLLGGLTRAAVAAHAVYSIDWIRETIGDRAATSATTQASQRFEALVADRARAEAACADALAASPRRLIRFLTVLTTAQRYARIREEHAWWFTLGWPVMRGAVLRLGDVLRTAGHLDRCDDIFFLRRDELDRCVHNGAPAGLQVDVAARRRTWDQQRRLSPPAVVGRPPFLITRLLLSTPRFLRGPAVADPDALHGTPASPGRATGPVRVLRDPSTMDAFRPGEVVVVTAATPALTALFDRAVAVCVDGGSVAAHASIIAREYGIPAVVGLRDATARLRDGALVTVDGTTGIVRIR